MWIWKRKPKVVPEPPPRFTDAMKEEWWRELTSFMHYAVDDYEDLMRSRDPDRARLMAKAARNLADAALDEYEDRFGV